MKRLTVFVALALLAGVPGELRSQTKSLGELFEKEQPVRAPKKSVDVFGWIERSGTKSLARVSLTPKSGTRLVANPGVTITPVSESGSQWLSYEEVYFGLDGATYFDSAPVIDIGPVLENGEPVSADISFAYCVIESICLFGEERIEIATRRVVN